MRLHYDYIGGLFPERNEAVCVLAESGAPFDHLIAALEQDPSFPNIFPSLLITTAAMAMHQRYGQQTFVLGPHVAQLLEHTSLEEIPQEELRFPYPCFYVVLEDCPLQIWGGERTMWHNLIGMYVQNDEHGISLILWGEDNENSITQGDDATAWARLKLGEEGDLEQRLEEMLSRKNLSMDAWIDDLDSNFNIKAVIEGSQSDGVTAEVFAQQKVTFTQAFRLAINLALYLDSHDAETIENPDPDKEQLKNKFKRAKGKKRQKYQKMLDRRSKATVIRVADSIEQRAGAQSKRHGAISAHWVRGHWRSYWTGKGRANKIRKWIVPHPRGLGEVPEARKYQIES